LEAEFRRIRKFLVPFFNDRLGERGSVDDGIAHFFDHVMDRGDVVVVAVGQDYAPDVLFLGLERGDVRNDEVYARSFLFRELDAHVDHDYLIFIFEVRAVATDLFEASERHEPYFVRSCRLDPVYGPYTALYCGSPAAALEAFFSLRLGRRGDICAYSRHIVWLMLVNI
jgi:hypothetical protein